MWRAWGIVLLLLSPQDLAPRIVSPDHEFAFQPPMGWVRHVAPGPMLVKFTQPGELKSPAEFTVTHLHLPTPSPLESFKRQTKEVLKEKFPTAKMMDEKDLTIGGRPAYRVSYLNDGIIYFKTCIHRSHIELYMLDAAYPEDQSAKLRPLIESSIATFEIIRQPLSDEEKVLDARTTSLIQAAKLDPQLLAERWFTVHIGARKVGHTRFKQTESEGAYAFETDVRLEFAPGDVDTTTIRGSYSPDGRVQKIDLEETRNNPKQKWAFRTTSTIRSGQAKILRDLDGLKEERSFAVEDGVLLSDVADCMRPVLIGAGKGNYLLKSLSPYAEDWKPEMIDVGGVEDLEFDGKPHRCVLVQAYVGRRKNMTYFYGTDRSLIRAGGHKEKFAIRQTTKEEALKP
jgi:hypothetical protein